MEQTSSHAFNLSFIREELAVGGSFPAEVCALLAQQHAIRHVVDLRDERVDDAAVLRTHGLELLHLPTRDQCAIARDMLDQGVAWVVPRIARRECVYVHCEHGVGRSVLLSMCVLVALGEAPLSALRAIKLARPPASPSPVQLDAFLAWAEPRVAVLPSWDELAELAYHNIPGSVQFERRRALEGAGR